MFNAGHVDYGEECERIDKKRCRARSRQSEQTKRFEQVELQAKLLNYFLGSNKSNINQNKLGKVHGNEVYQLNSLMETK